MEIREEATAEMKYQKLLCLKEAEDQITESIVKFVKLLFLFVFLWILLDSSLCEELGSCKIVIGLYHSTSAVCFNPLRLSADRQRTATVSTRVEKRRKRGSSVVCYATPMLSVQNLQWISTISCVALMFARGTGIHKSFVVPLFALQAPLGIISWMKGEYGIWAAFLALLTRLFFAFPGELELPFIALLLVIVAPYQVMSIRGKQEGAILSLAISCFLAFQHFSRAGSLQKAFDQSSVLATVAIVGVTVVSFLFLI